MSFRNRWNRIGLQKISKNWVILPLEESITHFCDIEFFELSYHHRGPEESEAAEPEQHTSKTATPAFDLAVARVSLCFDAGAFVFVFLSTTSIQWFASGLGLALGASLFPCLMSLALAVSPGGNAEAGALFGGFQVLSSLG